MTNAIQKESARRPGGWLRRPHKQKVRGRGKGTRLSEEIQRTAKTAKKGSSEQCKDRGKPENVKQTRDLFKKIGDIKGTFHARMSMKKDRNCMGLTEAEDIKKRWQEYTEEH